MPKAFIVTYGEYSDYRVMAIFTDRQLAENFSKCYGGQIEERELNPVVPTPPADK